MTNAATERTSPLARALAWAGLFAAAPLVAAPGCTKGSSGDGATADACATGDAGDRCSGSDPGYVFVPPLPPDVPLDASAAEDGAPPDGGLSANFYTDEACRAFLDEEAQGLVSSDTTSRTPTILEPTDGAVIPSNQPITLSWSKGPGARRGPLQRLVDWIEPSAYAHGSTTGDAYVVEFQQGCVEVLRVMLEATSWTADADSWQRLKALHGPISVGVVWAKYVQNDIAVGTVPARSQPITFTIGP